MARMSPTDAEPSTRSNRMDACASADGWAAEHPLPLPCPDHRHTAPQDLPQDLEEHNDSWRMLQLGRSSSAMTHDLNNLLTAVLGYLELARNNPTTPSTTCEHLRQAHIAATRSQELIDAFRRLEPGRPPDRQHRPLEFTAVVLEALTLLNASIPSSIEVIEHYGTHTPVLGNSLELLRLVTNLLTNAIKAMLPQEHGTLTIQLDFVCPESNTNRWGTARRYVRLTIEDTGPGIPTQVLRRIFQPDNTTARDRSRKGLGLTIANTIVRAHHGVITVDTEIGHGSVFRVYLPYHDHTANR